jgi:enoyl-CoA hydratase/carnithine racemase
MIDPALECRKSAFVAFIKMGDGKNRVLPSQIPNGFIDLCSEIAWDEDIRVVVVEFDGEIALPDTEGDNSVRQDAASMVEAVARLKQPVIAAIRGDGVGIGLELAMACDIRIGTRGARFGFPGIRDGVIPYGGGTQRLPRLVGRGKALEMLLTGDLIDESEAMKRGLVNRIVAAESLTGYAEEMGREMAEKSPLAVGYVKEALHNGTDLTLDQGLRMELDLYLLLFTTGDRVEGVTAFKEKRKPEFKGE